MVFGRISTRLICCAYLIVLPMTGCSNSEPLVRPMLTVQYMLPTLEKHTRNEYVVIKPGELQKGRCVVPSADFGIHVVCSYQYASIKESPGANPEMTPPELPEAYCIMRSAEFGEPAACLYQYVLINNVEELNKLGDANSNLEVKNFIHELLNFSRTNCNTFLDRMYANREGLTFWQKLLGNFGNTATGASAFATPYASAGISVASLVTNNGMDAAMATYYRGEQSPLEIAIAANRTADEAIILGRLEGSASYPIESAIADVNELDLDCSLDRGQQFLSNAAQSQGQGGGVVKGRLAMRPAVPMQATSGAGLMRSISR